MDAAPNDQVARLVGTEPDRRLHVSKRLFIIVRAEIRRCPSAQRRDVFRLDLEDPCKVGDCAAEIILGELDLRPGGQGIGIFGVKMDGLIGVGKRLVRVVLVKVRLRRPRSASTFSESTFRALVKSVIALSRSFFS